METFILIFLEVYIQIRMIYIAKLCGKLTNNWAFAAHRNKNHE